MAKRTPRQAQSAARVKRYRKLYAQAKRKGVVKGDKDAKTLQPTRYMRNKLNKLEPYLGRDYVAVKAPKELRQIWRDAPSEIVPKAANRKLLIKREPGVKVSIKGGVLSLRRKLGTGEYEELPLPANVHTLNQFRDWIENNRYYNDILKSRDEVFNFKIYGNASYGSFGNIEALISDLEKYENFADLDEDGLTWGDSPRFFGNFALYRSYKDWHWERDEPEFKAKRRAEYRERRRTYKLSRMSPREKENFLEREKYLRRARRISQAGYAKQKKQQREKRKNETPEQREKRRASAKIRAKKSRDKKRAGT